MAKKNITIGDLAIMIQKGFNETAKKDEVERRFKEVDRWFNDLKNEFADFKGEFNDLKNEFTSFKNETMTGQDKILKKLDILLTEKTVREYQEKRQKRFWLIIIKALKEHQILSTKELKEIAQLEIF